MLRGSPTRSVEKGQEIVGRNTGRVRIAKTGSWHLSAEDSEPGDLSSQVLDLLGGLNPDSEVWIELGRRFEIDIFAGLFMENWNEGEVLSSEAMYELGRRGISLGLDIYGPVDDSREDDA